MTLPLTPTPMQWIDGTPPRDLAPTERQRLARIAVRCLAMQLMTDGFIHCDPHEGNLLALRDGRVALLDFVRRPPSPPSPPSPVLADSVAQTTSLSRCRLAVMTGDW